MTTETILRRRSPPHPPRTSPAWRLIAVTFELPDGTRRVQIVEAKSREAARQVIWWKYGRKAKIQKAEFHMTPQQTDAPN